VLVREVRERRGEKEKSGQIEPTSTDITVLVRKSELFSTFTPKDALFKSTYISF
jgi:hypothetical protein